MSEYDGPTLRSLREQASIPLRRVSRLAGMSHGHLSKVERGEQGRPVTPAILAAYEKATGVRLTGATLVGFGDGSVDTSGAGWRRGRLSDARRRGFNSTVAAVAVGGPVGEPIGRLVDSVSRPVAPEQVGGADVDVAEQAARLVTGAELRYGGGGTGQLARALLRWAVGLTAATAGGDVRPRLYRAVGWLAQRAGWAAFDSDAHDTARTLFTVALDAAVQAGDRDLRAHVLADVAAQHNHLGYPDDALEVVALAEGDRRVEPAVRMVLAGVAARVHAAAAQLDGCRDAMVRAEKLQAQAAESGAGGWQATVCTEAHLSAATGHAAATLARRTGQDGDRSEAVRRLTRAAALLDPAANARMLALCAARLAMLQLAAGDQEQAQRWARQAVDVAGGVRSARLERHLRAVAAAVPGGGATVPAGGATTPST